MAGELAVDRSKGGLIHGGDRGKGPKIGAKYFKPALKRYLQKHPELVDKIAANLLDAAAGDKTVRVAIGDKLVDLDIPFRDQLKAAEVARDTLGEREVPTVQVDAAPRLQIMVVEDIDDLEDIAFPPKVVEMLKRKPREIEDELDA